MQTPEDWVDLDRLKGHLNFYQDEHGVFVGSEKDGVLSDCIAAAIRWCAAYTGLPLVEETLTVPCPPPSDLDQPIELPYPVVYPVRVAEARYWPDARRDKAGTRLQAEQRDAQGMVTQAAQFGRMETTGPPGTRAPCILLWPLEAGWPSLGEGGWEVDVVKDRDYEGKEGDAVAMAAIQCARDFYEGGAVMERKTAAMHLLNPFRYKGAGK